MNMVEVAAGLVFKQGKLLIAQRQPDSHLGGLWEFPGGKREPNETWEQCLARELHEELGIQVEVGSEIESLTHAYQEKTIHLRFFKCRLTCGEPRNILCAAWKWITVDELASHSFPPADARLLQTLRGRRELWQDE